MSSDTSSLDIRVHPLVVMSVADHYTRCKMQNTMDKPVLGVMLGVQDGLVITLLETFELGSRKEEGKVIIETKALDTDLQLFNEAYPNYELLGWYTTASSLEDFHMDIHHTMSDYNERPIMLILDPNDTSDNLPMKCLQSVVHQERGEYFAEIPCCIVADEAERVTMVHCANVVLEGGHGLESATTQSYTTLRKALVMLSKNIEVLCKFLSDVESGKIKCPDQTLLRNINTLCNRLPLMNAASDTFSTGLMAEYNDSILVTLLSSVTQGNALVKEVISKYNFSRKGIKPQTDPFDHGERDRYQQQGLDLMMGDWSSHDFDRYH